MSVESRPCDDPRVARFAQGDLPADEQRAFELHLDECADCQARLDDATASRELWLTTADFLSDGPFDLEPLSGPCSLGGGELSRQVADDGVRRVIELLGPTDDPRMLGRLGAYEIAGVVGSGGNGIVLKGLDPALNRYVAIKLLAPHLASSGAARQRFAREAQAAAAVVHENVIAIHGVSEFNGLPYLVMPYERGTSLQRRIDDHGALELIEILRVGMQTAAGLAAAHAQGLVHRDIKPANILLADGVERVTITDFGLARAVDDASMTRSGIIAGTPQFMSPEQARGEAVDHRSDLFSLGSVLYTMCTGHPPFRAETSFGILRRICDSEPRPIRESHPPTPAWLVRLIDQLHAKDPAQRYASASEVAELLGQCLAHVQQPESQPLPEGLLETRRTDVKRRRLGPGMLAGMLALTALIGFAFWLPHDQKPVSPKTNQGDASRGVPSPSTSAEASWDDGVAEMMLEVERDLESLERRAGNLFADDAEADMAFPDGRPGVSSSGSTHPVPVAPVHNSGEVK